MEIWPSPLGRRDWDDRAGIVALQDGWAYGAVAERHGARVDRLEIRDGAAIGFAQVLRRSLGPVGIAHLPLGVRWTTPGDAGDAAAALAALRVWLSRERPHILLAPSAARPHRLAPRLTGARHLCALDLGVGDLRGGLRKKWRNRLGAAERDGLAVAVSADIPDWLIRTERRQQRRRGYGNLTGGWIEVWRRIAPGAALTLTAGPPGAPIAAMSFVLHGTGATYLLGWTDPEGRRRSAHNLLMWRAIASLAARGFARIDLGRIDPEGNPGLARFKLGIGATISTLPPVHALLPSPAAGLRARHRPGPEGVPAGR